jgi:hypothetical protein
MRPLTPSVDYHSCFPRVVVIFNIIILDKLQLSSLPEARVRLHEDIIQTLMVRIQFTSLFHKVIPLDLESANHNG